MRLQNFIAAAVAGVALAPTAFAQPLGMPAREGGQWEVTMSGMGERGPMTMTMCVDPATERSFSPGAMGHGPGAPGGGGAPHCTREDVHPIAGGWAFNSVCPTRGGQVESSGTVTGDFRSHLHMVVDTKGPQGAHHMVMDQRRLGPCPAGGGRTITLPNGQVINIPTR